MSRDELEINSSAVEASLDGDAPASVAWIPMPTTAGGSPRKVRLKMPTLAELLESQFPNRQHLLFPWLREQESCMVYADTGVGKSLFALSAALAIAGGGEFLGWKAEWRASGEPWRVLYIDGEMPYRRHPGARQDAPGGYRGHRSRGAGRTLRFLARQHQDPGTGFRCMRVGAPLAGVKIEAPTAEPRLC